MAAMLSARFPALVALLASLSAAAAPPVLYHQDVNESPVSAGPDDLLLLAGYGFAPDDVVVYRAVSNSVEYSATPAAMPAHSDAEFGVAPVVSTAGVPFSLTIRLPASLRSHQTYALWVRSAGGEWSLPVGINDVRPLWFSPAYVYASAAPAFLPRELKVIGRNLDRATQIRLIGPSPFSAAAEPASGILEEYVARAPLPGQMTPGKYRVQVNQDGTHWVEVRGQSFEVLESRASAAQFSVSDPRFGGCRPDDGADDTACILRAIAAAERVGGTVYFGPGIWDLIDVGEAGLLGREGIVVNRGVRLLGAGADVTRVRRHREWNEHVTRPAFTLVGDTEVSGFTFSDLQIYRPGDRASPFLQVGESWQGVASGGARSTAPAADNVVITRNIFDKVWVAVGTGGLPINRLFITYNTFGAYNSALSLSGDQYNTAYKYRIDDSVIDYNVFKPGSKLDVSEKSGTLASELGAGHRLDFSGNVADGASTDYLYMADDARGWRAAFFWGLTGNVEEVLVSQNKATCTGDKIGDGEAIALDNNTNTFPFAEAPAVVHATADSLSVRAPLAARQHGRDIPISSYYIDHWIQIVSGPGLGQARRIVSYVTDAVSGVTTFKVAPQWDVVPAPGSTRMAVGREYWQLYVVGNEIDNRQPLCQKSNRSRRVAGGITLWAQSADSVIAGNRQYDSGGILVQQVYVTPEHPCADCTMNGYFHSFLDIRANLIDGEYDWANDCSVSGIALGAGAAPWRETAPPTVGFGISISHNSIRRADAEFGGAIAQLNSWSAGPAPHRWPLSDNVLIHHNSIADIEGASARPVCGGKARPRTGIAFPDQRTAWRTVLYANSCRNVSLPVGGDGIDTVKVCPSSLPDSCECPKLSLSPEPNGQRPAAN
jgi:hypothetical protein